MTSSPACVTPRSPPSAGAVAASRRAVAHFRRASTSAGPAVSRRTSSTPQSADSATRPPSDRTATSAAATPVEDSSPHSVRAWMRSWRASTRTTSPEAPSRRLDSSGATTRTWGASSPSAGSTSVVACRAAVMSTSRMSSPHGAVGRRRRPRTYDGTVEVSRQDNRRVIRISRDAIDSSVDRADRRRPPAHRSASGSEAGRLSRSTRDVPGDAVGAAGPGAPSAARRAHRAGRGTGGRAARAVRRPRPAGGGAGPPAGPGADLGGGDRPPRVRRLAGGGRGCRGGRRSRPRPPGPADAGRPPGGLRRRFPRRRPPADAPASPGGPRRVPLRDGVPALLGRRPRGAPPPGPDAGRPRTGDGGAARGRRRAGRGSSRRSRPAPASPGHGRAAGPAGPGAVGARRGGRRLPGAQRRGNDRGAGRPGHGRGARWGDGNGRAGGQLRRRRGDGGDRGRVGSAPCLLRGPFAVPVDAVGDPGGPAAGCLRAGGPGLTDRPVRALAVVAVLLLGLAVLVDRVAVGVAEGKVASELATRGDLHGTPEVDITGFPFLTQAIGGRYDDVRISLTADELGQPDGTRADIALHGVHVPLSAVVSGSPAEVPVDRIDGSATLSYALLSARLGQG